MIAEIRNKISSSGSNLSDRLEDQLTGNVFGALRYLPSEVGLRRAISNARFESVDSAEKWRQSLQQIQGYQTIYKFWPPNEEGEIDLMLDHPDILIGVEIKYFSSLSSEDEESEYEIDMVDSRNQLARYARMLANYDSGSRPKYLVFLAPLSILTEVEASMKSRRIIPNGVVLGYLSWQELLESIQEVDLCQLETGQKIILQDIMDLLVKKGFVRFTGFEADMNHFQITSNSYIFNESRRCLEKLHWPENTTIKDDNYVYNRSSRA
ncbi:hypothetical protein [Cohnella sp. GCM10027633]|uniref:hypothetical protein n=1 Tax=unclassified Cohnella TaxID=2636738 RepID=UPI0036289F23